MKQLRLAVFDCDGTLVDSQYSIITTMTATFEAHSLTPPTDHAIRRIIGLQLDHAIGVLLPDTPQTRHQEMAETYKTIFHESRMTGAVEEALFPGVEPMFAHLVQNDWLLGVATGKAMRGLKASLEHYDFYKHFVTLQTVDVARGKPDPDMLLRAMAETGVDARDTVMIGDTTFDMDMARNAGVKGVGVSWGYHQPAELQSSGAHVVIDEFDVLPQVLDDMMETV